MYTTVRLRECKCWSGYSLPTKMVTAKYCHCLIKLTLESIFSSWGQNMWIAPYEGMRSGIGGQRKPRSDCASAQSDQGHRCSQTESLESKKCFNGEQMPTWDFAHMQDNVNTYILRMLECTFLLDAARICTNAAGNPVFFLFYNTGKHVTMYFCLFSRCFHGPRSSYIRREGS